jgi:hypothetical protein
MKNLMPVAVLLTITIFSIQIQAQTPVAYYPFNGNVNDAIRGASGNAILPDWCFLSFTTDKNGIANSALDLNPDCNSISLPSITTSTNDFSVSLYVYIPQSPSIDPNSTILILNRSGNQLKLSYYDNEQLLVLSNNNADHVHPSCTLNTWNHIVISVNGGIANFFINGTLLGSTYWIASTGSISNIFLSSGDNGEVNFYGYLDDLAFYNTALTQAQVTELYTNGVSIPSNDWTINAANNTMYTTSFVGIGKNNPQKNLDVSGDINFTGNLYKNGQLFGGSDWVKDGANNLSYSAGKVGIGNTNPLALLHIGKQEAPATTAGESVRLALQPYGHTGGPWKFICRDVTTEAYLDIFYGTGQSLTISSSGNVGIGTGTAALNSKLEVNGKIRSKEVKVETANWPDFVFTPVYKLPSLGEVEQFIKVNGHLPEMPKAEVVQKDGVNLGEMQAKLLLKIEEMTLYIIDQDKKNAELQKKVEEQGKKIEKLMKAIEINKKM